MSDSPEHHDHSKIPGDFVKGVHEDPRDHDRDDRPRQTDESLATSLDERLQAVAEEANAARDQALRLQAELDNYRKRTQRDLAEERKYATLSIIRDLLPALDNLQRAIDAGRTADDTSSLLQGVEMVAAQIRETLGRYGAASIEAVGKPFDPNHHEAIQQMPSADHPPMTVLDEVEQGYRLHDRVIRPSKVIVSVAPPEPPAAS